MPGPQLQWRAPAQRQARDALRTRGSPSWVAPRGLSSFGFLDQLRGTELHLVDAALQEGRANEIAEEWVRPVGAGTELRVELAGDEPRVAGELDYLDEPAVGRHAAENHARSAE